jgi:hypothetical protein
MTSNSILFTVTCIHIARLVPMDICYQYIATANIPSQSCIVFRFEESELATKHCRYVVPTEIKLHPTFDDEMKTYFGNGKTATATANIWHTVQRSKQSARDTMSR